MRTPSCRDRLEVSAPTPHGPGRRSGLPSGQLRMGGYRARVVAARPAGASVPDPFAAAGPVQASATFGRAAEAGGGCGPGGRLGRPAAAPSAACRPRRRAARPAPPAVLTTGDSTIQGVDGFLSISWAASARRDPGARRRTGISKPFGDFSWLKNSRIQSSTLQARGYRGLDRRQRRLPHGHPRRMADVECCGPRWVAEYRRRARIMMRTWTRFGGHLAVDGAADSA